MSANHGKKIARRTYDYMLMSADQC